MDRFDPFVKYADVYGDIINWEKDPMNKPQNQNKYFFSDGKTYYEQICKMLRLMSVFKEAFNQIYSNEDEISEAWENFVNNLSASVVEGSEPDVTLTWTDDSVNFEFTMVPGVPGEQGVGITSISFNSDYTMTITLSDGNTYTSMSLKGETGPQGPQGETGSGLQILDVYATLADLQSAHPTGQPGDAYQVGSGGNYILYIWSSSQSAWVQAGTLGTVSPYTSAPLMDGTASAGSQNLYARGDHVHPSDTSRASKEELDALIKTSQALIDQSFIYRESPAIQDGLARIEKIKGNTLVWNQLALYLDSSGWQEMNSTTVFSNNEAQCTSIANTWGGVRTKNIVSVKANHKYLVSAEARAVNSNESTTIATGVFSSNINIADVSSTTYNRYSVIVDNATDKDSYFNIGNRYNTYSFAIKNVMFFDLTAMFGSGNEPSTVEEFTSLFPLPYYDYNAGTLLSFNGSGLKVTGKNLIKLSADKIFSQQNIAVEYTNSGAVFTANGTYARVGFTFSTRVGETYTISFKGSSDADYKAIYLSNEANWSYKYRTITLSATERVERVTFTATSDVLMVGFYVTATGTTGTMTINELQLEFGSAVTNFVPFAFSTTDLPILTYFATGMKSAGSVYDELTPEKAITRIGAVDLGSLSWNYDFNSQIFRSSIIDNIKPSASSSAVGNAICDKYTTVSYTNLSNDKSLCVIWSASSAAKTVYIHDSSYSDATAFKTAMDGVMLYYELATPTETAVDLDLDFMAYEDGTEQLLPVNGPVPSTSPIIADMTYLSIDDAMEYIIDKLANVPQNTQQILESLEDDVADLQTDVGTLQTNVSGLQTSVGNINTNIGQLSSTVAGHTASISDMQSDITDLNTDLSDLGDTVTDNTSRIGTLETDLASTDGQVQSLGSSVSTLSSTVSDQGTELGEIDSIIQDISNNPVISALGSHELGFVAAYVDATLPANTGTRVTIPKPTIFPNNYTPLFIVGMSTGAYNVSICEIPPTFGNSDSVNCRVWNHGSQQTTQITVYILCMRQRQSQ